MPASSCPPFCSRPQQSARRVRAALWISLCTSLCASALAQQNAAAEDWPQKPVRIVVQFQPGGATDTIARVSGEKLAQRPGQSVVVDNRSGAGGIIATEHAASSAPDGYTPLLALYKKLPYDPRTDLRMVPDLLVPPTVLAVHLSVAAQDFKKALNKSGRIAGAARVCNAAQRPKPLTPAPPGLVQRFPESLLAHIARTPGAFAAGSWGAGTQPHQIQTCMNNTCGLQTPHVACKGESPMAADLVGGVVQMTAGTISTLKPFIDSGKLRALASTGTRRPRFLPQVPTFVGQGYGDAVYTASAPLSLMAPAKTPDAIVERLGKEVVRAMGQGDVRQRMETLRMQPAGNSPQQAAAACAAYLPVALELARATGVTLD